MATIRITNRVMSIGTRLIQISNIAEASLWEDKTSSSQAPKYIFSGIAIVVGSYIASDSFTYENRNLLFISGGVGLIVAIIGIIKLRPKYALLLQTTAGKITPLASSDRQILDKILSELHKAMSHEVPDQNYVINVSDSIINSAVGNNVGGGISISS